MAAEEAWGAITSKFYPNPLFQDFVSGTYPGMMFRLGEGKDRAINWSIAPSSLEVDELLSSLGVVTLAIPT